MVNSARIQPDDSLPAAQNPINLRPTDAPAADFESALTALLVTEGVIDEKQLRYAKRIQAKLTQEKPLLIVLQDAGLVNRSTLLQAMRKLPVKPKLGQMLVQLGYLGVAELRNALSIQRDSQTPKRLGVVLVENNFLSEDKLLDVLAVQLAVPKVVPDFSKIDKQILRNINPLWCSQNRMIPVAMHKGRVVIAAHDPASETARASAEQVYGSKVLLAIAGRKSIDEAIKAFDKALKRVAEGKNKVGGSEAVEIVDTILMEALAAGASDIHVEPMESQLRVRFRCDGVMIPHKILEKRLADSLISRFKILAGADITEKRRHQDGRILFEDPNTGHNVDLRASFYVTIYGEKLVLRVLSSKVEMLNVEELGLPPRALENFYHDVLDTPSGIILITGPTGSGKTTTLYSCINYLNSIERSIITAEDPVEYLVEGIAQCTLNSKIDLSYKNTLPYMMRQDPDVIVLGEIRDHFSADAAIQAALTGHKVLTTFHTEDTIGGLLRLMNMNIETFMISSTVVSVLAQRLLRRVCPHCAEPYTPGSSELKRLGYTPGDLDGANFVVGRGCEHCRFTGYKGRLGVYELLILNEEVKDAILRNKSSFEIRRVSFDTSEMTTLLEDGLLKAVRGLTTLSEVLRHLPRIEKPRPLKDIKRLTGIR
ncbi:MAG: Flp pilus assembly complex ATPase component TadA [Gammaproteobacteria bacterium]|nr:Flp pilus assembly complex ATPase component TadA [Gammaproteobacteria bacterium]